MNTSFTIIVLILIGGALSALILRFVQPELIYGLRKMLLKVQANKLFLDREEGRWGGNAIFQDILVKDFRYEALDLDQENVFRRINKIRELYRLLDSRRPLGGEGAAGNQQPEVCIIELAAVLGSLGRQIVPLVEYHQPIISGRGILTHIANEIRKTQLEEPLPNDD